jgi:hypothetical protein
MKSYRKSDIQVFLSILLFLLGQATSHATNQPGESSPTLSDLSPKQAIYLAQSSNAEDANKREIVEEEEEEPECD